VVAETSEKGAYANIPLVSLSLPDTDDAPGRGKKKEVNV